METKELTREEKIKKIYEVIARKDLSSGCRVMTWRNDPKDYSQYSDMGGFEKKISIIESDGSFLAIDDKYSSWEYFLSIWAELYNTTKEGIKYKVIGYEIIGHPVMIGDVMDWSFEEKNYQYTVAQDDDGKLCYEIDNRMGELFRLWEDKRKPIDDQIGNCVDYVLSLIVGNE